MNMLGLKPLNCLGFHELHKELLILSVSVIYLKVILRSVFLGKSIELKNYGPYRCVLVGWSQKHNCLITGDMHTKTQGKHSYLQACAFGEEISFAVVGQNGCPIRTRV